MFAIETVFTIAPTPLTRWLDFCIINQLTFNTTEQGGNTYMYAANPVNIRFNFGTVLLSQTRPPLEATTIYLKGRQFSNQLTIIRFSIEICNAFPVKKVVVNSLSAKSSLQRDFPSLEVVLL